jgi:hypothetical protein
VKRSLLHIVLAPALAVLLFFAATPKDFLHEFAGHEDTVHSQHDDDGSLGFSNKHHHCSFLTLLAMPFEASTFEMQFVQRSLIRYEAQALPSPRGESREASCPASRGPPAA